ncbi:interleukin-13 receptor subunit alpha-1 [Symphorus nematophorus]
MTFTREFFTFLSWTAIIMILNCEADRCPPPTGLTYEWLDEFTVNVSWKKPRGLPDDSDVKFRVESIDDPSKLKCVSVGHFTESFLTEKKHSDHWTYNIINKSKYCNQSDESLPATITIRTRKPRAELVKDFRCFIYPPRMDCSWIPVNQSLNLTLSYRICGHLEEDIKSIKKCDEPYVHGNRNGCYLNTSTVPENICILVETEAVMSTFTPNVLEVAPPKLNITEEGDYLKLSWSPGYGNSHCWTYNICYTECDKFEICPSTNGETTMRVPYDKNCLYEFKSQVSTTDKCPPRSSRMSDPVIYGTNKLPDVTLYVVASVIAVILSICFILSCYCFRRHSAIICPIIPDPSAIFKEMMMMNGNREPTTGSLYTPVPEPFEPCRITVPENSSLQENS